METPFSCGLVWLRRDLRVSDHAALHQALKHCQRVHGWDRLINSKGKKLPWLSYPCAQVQENSALED